MSNSVCCGRSFTYLYLVFVCANAWLFAIV